MRNRWPGVQANQPAHVLVTGNADERGTVEYNLELGQRRAAAVRKYLEALGVPALRLDLVSYGKELPLCREHDESCWARNRRAGVRPNETPQDVLKLVQRDERRERRTAAKRAQPSGGPGTPDRPAGEGARQ